MTHMMMTSALPTQLNPIIILYFTIIYVPITAAYRRKTTESYRLTRPVRTTKEKEVKKKDDDDDYGDGDRETDEQDERDEPVERDELDEEEEEGSGDRDANDNMDDDMAWFDELKMDPEFADEEQELARATGTPMDLETYSDTWTSTTEPTTFTTTVPTSTTLMDLKVIGFNETWCTYIKKADNIKEEGEAFIELVRKLCSGNHSEDNDVRLAVRHTLENRKVIDRLMDDIVNRLSENDPEKKNKILNSKYKISRQNEFCYDRVLKSFKYVCFDPDMNPYMQRYLKIVINACRLPGLELENIREHIVEACESINSNLVDVV